MKVFITRPIPEAGLKLLQDKGYDVEVSLQDNVLDRAVLLEKVKGADAVLTMLNDTVDTEFFEAAGPQLKIVANLAVGYDNFDVAEAKKRSVYVTNTPEVLTETVAEHTFTVLLAISHRVAEGDQFMRAGTYKGWGPLMMLGNDVSRKTLGILGLGRIGARVAYHAVKGFDMQVIYYDVKRNEEFEKEYGAVYVSTVEEVLEHADFVSIHVPLLPETRHLINAERLRKMKPTAYLINTSRGPVIDEAALVEALKNHVIRGAALDVYENEPEMAPGLAELENVILTPHIASATEETRNAMAALAAKNIIEALEGRVPPNVIT
ncbi:D-glycerate dehydrogenase [Candidatus Azambacteria bacterium]|nr:D-glycerate dehydrogenase [Candidatus Azambacteria bacterium]